MIILMIIHVTMGNKGIDIVKAINVKLMILSMRELMQTCERTNLIETLRKIKNTIMNYIWVNKGKLANKMFLTYQTFRDRRTCISKSNTFRYKTVVTLFRCF